MDTPYTLLHHEIHGLRHQLAGVFDGDVTSVHDARVATRRIRELLPLIIERTRGVAAGEVEQHFRELHRRLGRVRDIDVQQKLIAYVQERVGPEVPSLGTVSANHQARRSQRARNLIKRVERMDVAQLLTDLEHFAHAGRRWWTSATWRDRLRRALVERAQALRDAIEHATGVYFPNRLHNARIAIKKLRYAMEIAQRTGLGRPDRAIKYLRKTQDLLGDLHDRHILIDRLRLEALPDAELKVADQLLAAESHDLHRRYLTRRSRLLDVCGNDALPRPSAGPARLAVAATVVAASSGLLLARHRATTA